MSGKGFKILYMGLFQHLEETECEISGELGGVFDEEKAVRAAL